MDNNEILRVVVEGEKFKVPAKFAQVSEYMRGLQALGFEDDDDIQVESVPRQTFQQILQFYQLCDYQQVFIKTPIKTNTLSDVLPEQVCKFIQRHTIESAQFKNLIKACEFLGCKYLLRVCAARCACYLYFEDSREAFEAKEKELGIEVKVKFEDNEKFKKLYPFMNS